MRTRTSSFVCVYTLILVLFVLPASPARAVVPDPRHTDVFVSGTEGYHTCRIPALLVTQKGTLLAFCEGRKNNSRDHGDIDLLLKRSLDAGQTWQKPQIVYDQGGEEEITIGNPCPVLDRDTGVIWLPFTRDNNDVLVTHSTDDGATWSAPRRITNAVKASGWGWYATGPGVGIQLRHGPNKDRLIIPCDHREKIDGRWTMFSHVFYSDDHGGSWQLGGSVAPHTDECQLVELTDGRLLINMRNYWGRSGGQPERGSMRAVAYSSDAGRTWSDLSFDSTLIEPLCQACLIRYSRPGPDSESILLFSNPATTDKRIKMTVRLSRDEAKTWPIAKLLNEGPSAYSCLAVLPNGDIACLYEAGRNNPYEKIIFTSFSLDWLVRNEENPTTKMR